MTETRAHDNIFLRKTTGKSSQGLTWCHLHIFFPSVVTVKMHSTLPVEKGGGRKPAFDSFVCSSKERECLKKAGQPFRCCLNKAMEMWAESSIWRLSNTGTRAACFFCCWRSEKLFPVISHLVTSRTNILLLLAPAVIVFFPLLLRQMVQELW